MTVEEYKRWQAGKKTPFFGRFKPKSIIKFWETNPAYEQELFRSESTMFIYYLGVVLGTITGLSFGFMVGASI